MPELARLAAQIEIAAGHITPYWPLHRFIAANPLQGLEEQPFEHAAQAGSALFGGRALPAAGLLRAALADGRIDPAILDEIAAEHGDPAAADPAALDQAPQPLAPPAASAVNRAMIRWLAAFLDEGQAAWPMPERAHGLWPAFRALARHDREIPRGREAEALPADPLQAIAGLAAEVPDAERATLFTRHLAALPGWSGYVKWRAQEAAHPFHAAAPATLADVLAMRLFLARQFAEPLAAPACPATPAAAAIWLEAWEETWRRALTRKLATAAALARGPAPPPQAQLVFCIDVRSEVLRRHLERRGPWATLGFAGFFGAAVAVQPFGAAAPHASCPVLLQPRHLVPEVAAPGAEAAGAARLAGLARLKGAKAGLRALKESVAGAFGFVEASGAAFGAAMVARTVAPRGFAGSPAGCTRRSRRRRARRRASRWPATMAAPRRPASAPPSRPRPPRRRCASWA